MPALIDSDAIPYFSHPMNRVATEFYHRQPLYVAMDDGIAHEIGFYYLHLENLEAFREWAERLRPEEAHEGLKADALQTAHRLIELLDWRWYAWEALRLGVVHRLDGDGHFTVRIAPHEEEVRDIFASVSRADACDEWIRLARMVAAGNMDAETLRALLSERAMDDLAKCGKLPGGLR
ncbi:MAG: hypothetical protein ACO1SV_27265 [Fimbriimonas sp.]